MISAMKAKKLIKHRAWAFLVSTETDKANVNISSVPVVKDFQDVFPEELPSLPPVREVDFGIELEPRTQPISKAPYRMAPAELNKFKEQLQE